MRVPPLPPQLPATWPSPWEWLAPVVAVSLLAPLSQWNYLLFHVSSELFISAVGLMMFFIASSVARFGRSHFMLVLGAGFFWVALLELFHTIAYKGMGVLFHGSANEATQLWVAARLIEALTLVVAPLFIGRRVSAVLAFLGFGLLAVASASAIILARFPDAYVEPGGLTAFKVAMEWLVIALFGVSALLLRARRADLPRRPYHLLMAALALSTAAELAFTLYTGPYTYWNIIGHLLIFLAFWLIFLATVKTMMTEPFVHVTRDATILELSPDPTVLITEDCLVTRMNRAAKLAFDGGRPSPEHLSLFDLIGPSGQWSRSRCDLEGDPRRAEGFPAQPTTLKLGNVWYDLRILPLRGSILGKAAIAIFRDITESKRAQDILVQSNAELEQFAHVLSHELQTPIRSMVSYLGLIQHRLGDDLDEEVRQDMDLAVQAGKRMSAMIHGLLDYANARPVDHPLTPVNLDQPLADALAALASRLTARRAHVSAPHGLPTVLGNRDQLAHVFQELLENATKYTPADRTPDVDIFAKESEEQVHLSFLDNGLGVPAKDSQTIFGLFKRLHADTEYSGTGLGLAICKRLIELHGGRITFRPRMDASGSIFTVTLWKEGAARPTDPSDQTSLSPDQTTPEAETPQLTS
ncbi:MAG: hypothetical protein K9H25_19840 [Rhodospirillum sp.]|nr:hypothetical protein [Rhodospirillum sp.]MCF8491607.1 hypothetical protein [Rhodospirillum sp.]MCF8499516.1 hypothetical protein [Rhodospirillum sp.]